MNDPFFNSYFSVERLYDIYLKHKKLIIATDFDETIFDFHNKGYKFPKVIDILKECNQLGFHVIIFTASRKERHAEILQYAKFILGLSITSINENAFPMKYGNEGKIFYNLLLDDKAGLGQAYEILRKTLDKIKEHTLIESDINV